MIMVGDAEHRWTSLFFLWIIARLHYFKLIAFSLKLLPSKPTKGHSFLFIHNTKYYILCYYYILQQGQLRLRYNTYMCSCGQRNQGLAFCQKLCQALSPSLCVHNLKMTLLACIHILEFAKVSSYIHYILTHYGDKHCV